MNNQSILINDRRYLKIELIEVNQKNKSFFIGKLPASNLLDIYTVRPAVYDLNKNTSLAESFPEEKEFYEHLLQQNENNIAKDEFQRKYDPGRIKDIKKFLEDKEYAFFPNTVIVTCDLINESPFFEINDESTLDDFKLLNNIPYHLSFLNRSDKGYELYIPDKEGTLLIIDGQHRVEGLKATNIEFQSNYEVLLSFMLGFDRSVIAQQFYTINYEQKPVNKSLLYHLMGEFSSELDETTFLHKMVKVLNEVDRSPFFKRVKMLGKAPDNILQEDKIKLSISLAFLIDELSRSISKKKTSSIYQPIFRYYFERNEKQIEIIRFFMTYFNSVKRLVPGWENPKENLISKGMGVGAMVRILHLLFVELFVNEWNFKAEKINEVKENDIDKWLDGIQNVDFSKDGPFGRSGSSGSINKIRDKVFESISYFESYDSYSDYLDYFKSEDGPLNKFKKWVSKNTEIKS